MAIQENYTFPSSDEQKTMIHGVKWSPENGEVKAVIQLVHGMIEYIERYTEFAEFLADRGFVVMGHDHIGHGESVSSHSDWGIMHTSTPSETLVEDMFSNYKIIKEQYPDKPYFILGHSMGSYLLREYLCTKSSELKGVNGAILTGTGTLDDKTAKAGMKAIKFISAFRGYDYKSKMVAKLQYDKSYDGYSVDGSDPEKSWLSTNQESVKKYYADPKDTFEFSLNGYRLLTDAAYYDNQAENIAKMNMDIPILFSSGEKDPVGGLGVGTTAAYQKFIDAGVKDCSIKLYEGDRHEILQEMDRQTVFEDFYQWMSAHM